MLFQLSQNVCDRSVVEIVLLFKSVVGDPEIAPCLILVLALFIEAGPTEKPKIYVRDLFRSAHHEVDLRLDARNIENNLSDPVYTSLKYRFNSMHTLSFGLTAKHDVGTAVRGRSR